MVIHAYPEDCLHSAQRIMGDMLDYASDSYELDPDDFFQMFLISDVAYQFQTGNPSYVAGKTGCELVKEVIRQSGLNLPDLPEEMYLDKSPEYWAGHALAFYQWYTGKTFQRIYKAVSVRDILNMYPAYHEMEIMRFVSAMDEKLADYYKETNLKRLRQYAGLSQSELAELSKVPLRQIQLFEQRQRKINHTKAVIVLMLARALGCRCEDLLEI